MNTRAIHVLLIEDDRGDAEFLAELLSQQTGTPFCIDYAGRLAEGLEYLTTSGIEVVLLDLSLPDSHGLETVRKVRTFEPRVPIIVLTGLDDDAVGFAAVQEGAQDYLEKGNLDAESLVRSIRYAIERHRTLERLQAMSLTDELTGLYNRRGFYLLAEQQLKSVERSDRCIYLVYADLDNFKRINDTLGHEEGDLALVEAADVLKETFRTSDIIARVGGDEFAVLAVESSPNNDHVLTSRLEEHLRARNTVHKRRYPLSMSVGLARHGPKDDINLADLLALADASMYQSKRRKKAVADTSPVLQASLREQRIV